MLIEHPVLTCVPSVFHLVWVLDMPFKLRLYGIIYLENGEKWPHERGKMVDIPVPWGASRLWGCRNARWLPLTATTVCPFLTLSRMSRSVLTRVFLWSYKKYTPEDLTAGTYSHHPWKRKENDSRTKTSRELCSMWIFQGVRKSFSL